MSPVGLSVKTAVCVERTESCCRASGEEEGIDKDITAAAARGIRKVCGDVMLFFLIHTGCAAPRVGEKLLQQESRREGQLL